MKITEHEKQLRTQYAKGYRAGKRCLDEKIEAIRTELNDSKAAQRERIFLSVFNGLLVSNKGCEHAGEKVTTIPLYVKVASNITDQILAAESF